MSGIDELRAELASAAPRRHPEILERFWTGPGARTPLVEAIPGAPAERRMTFLWRDAEADAVLIAINRITHDVPSGRLERLAGTDVWHRSYRLGADWRGSYTVLAADAARFAAIERMEPRWAMRTIRESGCADPRNPRRIGVHGGIASVAELPDAAPLPWPDSDPAVRGTTTEHRLDGGRRVWLHRPFGDDAVTARPLVIVLDGEVWHRTGDAATAVDALAEAGTIRAPRLLLVDAEGSPRRMRDLSVDGGMSEEIVEVLLPWARSVLPVSADPADVIVSGESLGGLTALKTAFDHPDAVGAALAQSSSLWQHDMLERAAASAPVRLYLTAGRHEERLIAANRTLAGALRTLPHDHVYVEFNGGHDMAWWRGLWAEGLLHLLGR